MDIPIRVGIITISDRSAKGERPDASGPALEDGIAQQGWNVVKTTVLPDDYDRIVATLIQWTEQDAPDVILTTGGTGFSPRDITPEASLAVIERLAPGIAEALRSASLSITPHAMLSRATAGIRSHTLIVNFPGSPKAAIENLAVLIPVLPHAVQLLRSDASSEAGHQAF